MTTDSSPAPRRPRVIAVDVARGVALVAMIAYHLTWDLSFLGFYPVDISVEPGWMWFQRAILGSFLFLVGASLVLAHGERVRWGAFWRRTGILADAAAAVTLGTWFLFGDALAFFGILHAIVLFSVVGVLFLRLPVVILLLVAAAFIVPGVVFRDEAFNVPWLAWLGFWTVPPRTADLVPVFPWLGVTLLGIAGAGAATSAGLVARLAQWRPGALPLRALAFAGRWSLLIYLLHQPLILSVLYPLANWLQPGVPDRVETFAAQCQPSCVSTGGEAGYCRAYCACVLDQIQSGDLWSALESPTASPESQRQLDGVITLCRAMAEVPAQSGGVVNQR